MRAVVQRVSRADVMVDGVTVGSIGNGLFVLLGVGTGDVPDDIAFLAQKIAALRIFEDPDGKMNLSIRDVSGELLIVSQFTLFGDARKGNRPSFVDAMPVDQARAFWPVVEDTFRQTGVACSFGVFQGDMKCSIVNEGPVTLILDSRDGRRQKP